MRPFIVTLLTLVVVGVPARAEPTDVDKQVKKGLEFLKDTQQPDGSWHDREKPNAANTGLAVLAFLSNGYAPGEGPYGKAITNGIEFVIKSQQENGVIATVTGYEMYHHSMCTMMLAEVAAASRNDELLRRVRPHLERAVKLILRAQVKGGFHKGGWRYRAGSSDADASVTGWVIKALRAGRNVGCEVPKEAIDNAIDFLRETRQERSGGFAYTVPGPNREFLGQLRTTADTTAACVTALTLTGTEEKSSPILCKAGDYILDNKPTLRGKQTPERGGFSCANYHCTCAMFALGGKYWQKYREHLHGQVLPNQEGDGCWIGGVTDTLVFGKSYGTAMAVLALTVEKRRLTLYLANDEAVKRSEHYRSVIAKLPPLPNTPDTPLRKPQEIDPKVAFISLEKMHLELVEERESVSFLRLKLASHKGEPRAEELKELKLARTRVEETEKNLRELADDAKITPGLRSLGEALERIPTDELRQAAKALEQVLKETDFKARDEQLRITDKKLAEARQKLGKLIKERDQQLKEPRSP